MLLVVVPAAEVDFDERHARFDQPAGHQAAAAEVGVAVRSATVLRFLSTLKASICLLVSSVHGLLQNLGVVGGRRDLASAADGSASPVTCVTKLRSRAASIRIR